MREIVYNIIAKHFSGETSEKEDAFLNKWLMDDDNKNIYNELKSDWMLKTGKSRFNTDTAWANVQQQITHADKTRKRRLSVALSIAATLIFASVILFNVLNSAEQQVYITSNDSKNIVLPDGSKVHLNKNSVLTVMKNFNKSSRLTKLTGEAYFEITKNAKVPFIINANGTEVTVVGTSFNIKSNDHEQFELLVTSGVVNVRREKQEDYTLTKGQSIQLKNQKLQLEKFNNEQISWHNRYLHFEFTPLNEAVEMINNAYNSHIKLMPDIQECVINSTFDNEALSVIVESICQAFSLTQNIKNDTIVLSGEGCNN